MLEGGVGGLKKEKRLRAPDGQKTQKCERNI